ncbi:hypothetical protein AB8B02_06185 [Tardiphaga sp. 862_B3_N4_1]|jgi:hypothetical protein|uniref:hypothetical protein n=1 Tax=Tardiphaga sp. 862_B3_N4_1 TaxID=3240764 RepID=UPI003F1E57AF
MNPSRYFALVNCFVLSACAAPIPTPVAELEPIAPPDAVAMAKAFTVAAKDAKLSDPLEVSAARPAGPLAPGAPGAFVACLRGVQAGSGQKEYALFFKRKDPVVQRLALNPDGCIDDAYVPFHRMPDEVKKPF